MGVTYTKGEQVVKSVVFTKGRNVYDFFVVPTIRYNNNGFLKYLTVEWLRWFIGISCGGDK